MGKSKKRALRNKYKIKNNNDNNNINDDNTEDYDVFDIIYYYDKNDPHPFDNAKFFKDVKGKIVDGECVIPIEWDITNDINEAYKFYEEDHDVKSRIITNLFDSEFLFDFLEGKDKELMIQRTVEVKSSDNEPIRLTGDGYRLFLDFVDNKRTLVAQNMWHTDLHRSTKKVHTYNLNTMKEIKDYTYSGGKAIFDFLKRSHNGRNKTF